MTKLSGIVVPLVTPFHNDKVDFAAAERLAAWLVDQGVHGLVVAGTTGEGCSLDESEKIALAEVVVNAVGRRVPVLMGLSGSNTRHMAREARAFEVTCIDGYLVSAPSYVRPTQSGILTHFRYIAAATELPIIIYNIPARTGVNIEPVTIAELAASGQFTGVKECGNARPLIELLQHSCYTILSGDDTLLLQTLALGGHGAIAASAHIRPDLFIRIHTLACEQRFEEAREIFDSLLPLIRLLFSEPNPTSLKAALSLQGWISNELRIPMLPASQACTAQLHKTLQELNALNPVPQLNGVIYAA